MKYLLCVLFALLLALPLLAQDETVTPVATQEASPIAPVNVNINTDSGRPDTLPEGNISIPGWTVVVSIVLSIAGGAGIALILDRIRQSPAAITEIEGYADNSVSETTANAFVKGAEVVESAARLVKEAFDRIPASDKPSEISSVPSDVLRNELVRRGEL